MVAIRSLLTLAALGGCAAAAATSLERRQESNPPPNSVLSADDTIVGLRGLGLTISNLTTLESGLPLPGQASRIEAIVSTLDTIAKGNNGSGSVTFKDTPFSEAEQYAVLAALADLGFTEKAFVGGLGLARDYFRGSEATILSFLGSVNVARLAFGSAAPTFAPKALRAIVEVLDSVSLTVNETIPLFI